MHSKLLLLFFTFSCAIGFGATNDAITVTDVRGLNHALQRGISNLEMKIEGSVVIADSSIDPKFLHLFLRDGSNTVVLAFSSKHLTETLHPGDRVLIDGPLTDVAPYDAPVVKPREFRVLFHADLPPSSVFADLNTLHWSNPHRPIFITGIITDAYADKIDCWSYVTMESNGEIIYVVTRDTFKKDDCIKLIGAKASIAGLMHGTEGYRQLLKRVVSVNSLESISILTPPPSKDFFTTEIIDDPKHMPHNTLFDFTRKCAIGHVVAVWGKNKALIRTASGNIVRVELSDQRPPAYGDHIRACGFPETDLYNIILVRAIWRIESKTPPALECAIPVQPEQLQPSNAAGHCFDFRFHGHPVTLTGTVRNLPVQDGDSRLFLDCGGLIVTVNIDTMPKLFERLQIGSLIEATGVCVMETEKMGMNRIVPDITGYHIVARTPDDINILSYPSWWTTSRLLAATGSLFAVIVIILIWNTNLRRQIEHRSAELIQETIDRVTADLKTFERTRLSVELHDSTSQNLIAALMKIDVAKSLVKDKDSKLFNDLEIASKTLKSCRDEIKNCIWDLRSDALDEPNMGKAIHAMLRQHLGTTTLTVRFNIRRELLTDQTAHTILSIIRELSVNAVRHGKASHIRIAGSIENGELLVRVRDNGCGFDPSSAPSIQEGHFGLQGIRERIREYHGKLNISSIIGEGTKATICLRLPPLTEKEII